MAKKKITIENDMLTCSCGTKINLSNYYEKLGTAHHVEDWEGGVDVICSNCGEKIEVCRTVTITADWELY